LNTSHITGHRANTAPAATLLNASDAGNCHNSIAITRPTIRPASDACQAGRRTMPSATSTVAIGSAATIIDSSRLPPTGVNI
jgi:hypothetical protein